ncbi:MAG: 2-hydroxyacyl-CoA dehydratase family protein [Acidobacteriota bacterium]
MSTPNDAVSIPRRAEVIREFKGRGGRVAAVLPIHYPRALFRAFDILPVEVWGPPKIDASSAATHLQPYICSIARNALAFVLGGGLDVADLIIVPHTCDSLQGLASVLIDFITPARPVYPIYLPRGNRPSDLTFLASELRSLSNRLEQLTAYTPSETRLMECIEQEEAADRWLADLHQRRTELPLSQYDLYRVLRSREFLPADRLCALAETIIARAGGYPRRDDIPVLMSGIVPEPMEMLRSLEKMGGRVASDDFACCGRRLYPAGRSSEPFVRMAESIIQGPPDPMRGCSIQDRLAHLARLAGTSGARGVVFYTIKFCEPELFQLPALRTGLQEIGVRTLNLEVDLSDPLSQSALTRLEAFLEMIG